MNPSKYDVARAIFLSAIGDMKVTLRWNEPCPEDIQVALQLSLTGAVVDFQHDPIPVYIDGMGPPARYMPGPKLLTVIL